MSMSLSWPSSIRAGTSGARWRGTSSRTCRAGDRGAQAQAIDCRSQKRGQLMKTLFRLLAGVLLVLLLATGGFIAWSWAPDIPVDELKARWGQPPSQFVVLDGLQVHLRDEGPRDDPEPIV